MFPSGFEIYESVMTVENSFCEHQINGNWTQITTTTGKCLAVDGHVIVLSSCHERIKVKMLCHTNQQYSLNHDKCANF